MQFVNQLKIQTKFEIFNLIYNLYKAARCLAQGAVCQPAEKFKLNLIFLNLIYNLYKAARCWGEGTVCQPAENSN